MHSKWDKIANELRVISKDGRITCSEARKLAEDLEVPYSDIGETANQLKIKIHKCQLGCF